MKTKLTLTIEKKIVEQAKHYAAETDQSLSQLIENYLRNITNNQASEPNSVYQKTSWSRQKRKNSYMVIKICWHGRN